MTKQELKARDDFRFKDVEIEDYWLRQIRAVKLDHAGDYKWGAAYLEIGNVDIEVNITSKLYMSEKWILEPTDIPDIAYFICVRCKEDQLRGFDDWYQVGYMERKPKVDWNSEEWKQQLKEDMLDALIECVEKCGFNYDELHEVKDVQEIFNKVM